MHRALSACCDRSIATHEGIRAPRDIANLSRFVLASLRCTPPSESKLFEVSVSWVGLGRRPTPSGQIWTRLSKPFDQFETVYSGVRTRTWIYRNAYEERDCFSLKIRNFHVS